MTNVLQGIRVVEVADYAMVPAASAALADWGADVIKIEHAQRGDPLRGIISFGIGPDINGFSFLWETFNRGKRSIGLDLTHQSARQVLYDLIATADVFITSYLPSTRQKLGIDVDQLRAVNPQLIIARGSAHGALGEQADVGGYDSSTYWFRTGIGMAATPVGSTEVTSLPAPAFGDCQTGIGLAAGVCAALFHRLRTGEATTVDTSLLGSGVWAMQASLVGVNVAGLDDLPRANRATARNPIANTYRTSDGRFLVLSMLQADRLWPGFCAAIGRDDLVDDPRFTDIPTREANSAACVAELDATFATRTLAEWTEALSAQPGPWAAVRRVRDLNDDRQVWANGYLQTVDYGDGRTLTLASAPAQFDEEPPQLNPAPAFGAHTEELLLELGRDWDQILALKDDGAIN
ncbi:MAG: L-carnitine dehydratase/bile acid-inducible protein [Ilumatobacteraceae bacterium]|nr:L-carnitine dehydratase/bile acid-inducible protein [Ilumatobacteraceae bacterium]